MTEEILCSGSTLLIVALSGAAGAASSLSITLSAEPFSAHSVACSDDDDCVQQLIDDDGVVDVNSPFDLAPASDCYCSSLRFWSLLTVPVASSAAICPAAPCLSLMMLSPQLSLVESISLIYSHANVSTITGNENTKFKHTNS